jgi:hypothetical protein
MMKGPESGAAGDVACGRIGEDPPLARGSYRTGIASKAIEMRASTPSNGIVRW